MRWIKGKPRFKVNYVPAPNYAQGKVIHNVTSEFIESYCSSDNKDRQYLYSSLPLQNIEQKKEIILEKDEFFLLSYNEKVIPVDIEREKLNIAVLWFIGLIGPTVLRNILSIMM